MQTLVPSPLHWPIPNPNPAFVTESETHSWRDKLTTAHKRSGPSGGLSPRLSFTFAPLSAGCTRAQVQTGTAPCMWSSTRGGASGLSPQFSLRPTGLHSLRAVCLIDYLLGQSLHIRTLIRHRPRRELLAGQRCGRAGALPPGAKFVEPVDDCKLRHVDHDAQHTGEGPALGVTCPI